MLAEIVHTHSDILIQKASISSWISSVLDSLLSIVQMPGGVPVATVAINNAKNAGILAAQMVGSIQQGVAVAVDAVRAGQQ